MRAKSPIKSAILAALTILSSVPAYAGDFRTKERLPKTALGGESAGGGQVRVGYYSTNELMKILETILKNKDQDSATTDIVIDKNLQLVAKENKTEVEIETVNRDYKIEKMADGRYLVKNSWGDYDNDFFEIKKIKNPLLKSVLTKLMQTDRVDYDFVRKHEKAMKYAYERANPGEQFDAEMYRNLVIETRAMYLDFVIMSAPGKVHLQKAACKDIDGKPAPSAVTKFERFTPICFSVSMLAQIPMRLLESEMLGLYFHELAHQHKIGENGAIIFQQFIVEEVISGRSQLRGNASNLRGQIDSAMEYAEWNINKETGLIDLKYFYEGIRTELTEMRTLTEKALLFNERDATFKVIKVLEDTVGKLKNAKSYEEQVVLINELWAQTYDFTATIPVKF